MADRPQGIHDVDAEARDRGHESRDVRIGPMIWLFLGFLGVFALLCGGLWWFYRTEARRPLVDESRSVVAPKTVPSAGPPLQPQVGHESLDAWDLRAMREHEDTTFAAIGWRQDGRTKRFAVPAEIVETLRRRQASSRPTEGARP